ncbi:riboflavin synthase [Canibacter sp. lx-45]|uniref:riboflavin synthase n=1 Tax=Canibacter zhuwentaonis TaxID=2837491 RepID=UPI001BDCF611|nr:riboflavin synthase [Canibacter zhuwentaonis]MBT1035321.1 riboflavin synthase [Canibacter zhuwentaonis]
MFTGLVEKIGRVVEIVPAGDGARITVQAPEIVAEVKRGDSISTSGVCLTVADYDSECFSADVMQQTLDVSVLGGLTVGDSVNLERAMQLDTRLGGHIVQGHVDGIARVRKVRFGDQWQVIRFAVAPEISMLLVDKGSVCVDGVSLTVAAVADPPKNGGAAELVEQWFEVALIPETLTATTLGQLRCGDRVNIETDIFARHLARLAGFKARENSVETGEL